MDGTKNYLDVLARRCQAASDAYDDAWYRSMVHNEHRALDLAAARFTTERHMYITAQAELEPESNLTWRDRLVSSEDRKAAIVYEAYLDGADLDRPYEDIEAGVISARNKPRERD